MEAEGRGKEGQGRERERVRFEDARLLALKMEKGLEPRNIGGF